MENIPFLGSSAFSERQGGNRELHAKMLTQGVWAVPFVLSQEAHDLMVRTKGRCVMNVIVDIQRPTFAAPPVMSAALHAAVVVTEEEYEQISSATKGESPLRS
jgi:hypothetical protein